MATEMSDDVRDFHEQLKAILPRLTDLRIVADA